MNTISLQEAKEYIDSIDFSRIIDKLVNHGGWIRKDAEKTCQLYRNFLFLSKKYQDQGTLPPSEDVDEFWHAHILDTKMYLKDCDAIFGCFLHHYPYLGIDGKTDFNYLYKVFEKTQSLHLKEFGEMIPATRAKYPKWIYALKKYFS